MSTTYAPTNNYSEQPTTRVEHDAPERSNKSSQFQAQTQPSNSNERSITDDMLERSSFLTRSGLFQKLSKRAFDKVKDENGKISKKDIYTSILETHLKIAKYAGPAACFPPSQETVEKMFDAADADKSGYIDEKEFSNILTASSVDCTSRIFAYYMLIILCVPFLASYFAQGFSSLDDKFLNISDSESSWINWIGHIVSWRKISEKVINGFFGMMIIPLAFDFIDGHSTKVAKDLPTDPKNPKKELWKSCKSIVWTTGTINLKNMYDCMIITIYAAY